VSLPFQACQTAVAFPSESSTTCGLPANSLGAEMSTGGNQPACAAGAKKTQHAATAASQNPNEFTLHLIDPDYMESGGIRPGLNRGVRSPPGSAQPERGQRLRRHF
jgi:hypothetical protein